MASTVLGQQSDSLDPYMHIYIYITYMQFEKSIATYAVRHFKLVTIFIRKSARCVFYYMFCETVDVMQDFHVISYE